MVGWKLIGMSKEEEDIIDMLVTAINALGEKPEFKEAYEFLMSKIPTVECP